MNSDELIFLASCRRLMTKTANDPVVHERLSGVRVFIKVDEGNKQLVPKEFVEVVTVLRAAGRNPCTMREPDLRTFLLQSLPALVPVPKVELAHLSLLHDRLRALREQLARLEAKTPDLGAWDSVDRLLREVEGVSGMQVTLRDGGELPVGWPAVKAPPTAPAPKGEAGSYLCVLLARLGCKLGCHDWEGESDTVKGDTSGKHIALGWWVCRRCSESKLTLILR